MKNMKKFVSVLAAVGVLGSAGVVLAATASTPAEIAAELTGKQVEELYTERAAGKTYGTIAKDAGKLEEFKQKNLEQKKAILDQRVKDGKLTQEKADEIYNAIKNSQANCDGSSDAIGKEFGAGFGQGSGMRNGQGAGQGVGKGAGQGQGQGKGMGNGGGMRAGRGVNR